MARVRKLVGAVLGGLTAGAIVGVGRLLGWGIEPEVAAALVTILAAVGTYVSPANEPALRR
jgi:hypothetical protein